MVRKTIGSYISVLENVNLGIKDLRLLNSKKKTPQKNQAGVTQLGECQTEDLLQFGI